MSKPEDSIDGVCHCPTVKKGEIKEDGLLTKHKVCNGLIKQDEK